MVKRSNQNTNREALSNLKIKNNSSEKAMPMILAAAKNFNTISQSVDSEGFQIEIEENKIKEFLEYIELDDNPDLKLWVDQFATATKKIKSLQEELEQNINIEQEECRKERELAQKMKEENLQLQENLFNQRHNLEEKVRIQKEFEKDLAQRAQLLQQDEKEFLDLKRELFQREENARHGFVVQNKAALQDLEKQKQELIEFHSAEIEKLVKQKLNIKQELAEAARNLSQVKFNILDAEQQRLDELSEREVKIKELESQQISQKKRIEQEWKILKQAQNEVEIKVEEKLSLEKKCFQEEIGRIKNHADKAWKKVSELNDQLQNYKELEEQLAGHSAEDFLASVESIKQENRSIKKMLEQTDFSALEQQNELLIEEINTLRNQISELRPAYEQAKAEVGKARIAATELHTKELQRRVLEQNNNILEVHINDLETRINQLTEKDKANVPFPAMTEMDHNCRFKSELQDVPELEIFAEELQHRIAQADHTELYYSLEDIRILLGGLAMSQLHVFQGISGTGKTSLAKAFAKAMGGVCTDIAVQAGWRDRDDLLGHYNAFERRFYEKDCLQALYQAQTPQWGDRCNIILLDEMNLSRPEQYFSEFLSALEKNNPADRCITLTETALNNPPNLLKDGRQILVPKNIWFIGTANHDETTNELADKTYDRAHVMTLPKNESHFNIKKYASVSYSFKSLQQQFEKSIREYKDEVKELLDYLKLDSMTEILSSEFSLGWGNRFERQANRFIPVMLATGASKGQALDHLLATRVMRKGKVTERYDIDIDAVEQLKTSVEDFWRNHKFSGEPTKTLKLLNSDLKLKGYSH